MIINNLHVGYACINTQLAEIGIRAGKDIKKDTYKKIGLTGISEVVLENLENLKTILEWNRKSDVDFYRLSSGLFPWMSDYGFADLPHYDEIVKSLKQCGDIANSSSQRLTFHPGPFVVLASPHSWIREKARKELEQHSQIFDLMGFEPSTWNKINIHIGGAYGDKNAALDRWKSEWDLLNDNTKSRLVVENDDKSSMYSIKELYDNLHKDLGISLTFDSFHHDFCTGGLEKKDAAQLAASTWLKDPCFHFASSMKINENAGSVKTAHANWIYEDLTDWGTGAWIMVEAKAKELAIFHYKNKGKGKPDIDSISEDLKPIYSKYLHV